MGLTDTIDLADDLRPDGPDPQHTNLGQRWMGPAPIGSHPGGVSDHGCLQMLGDVWEWTSSEFRPRAARATFRNWDLPVRRQIFAGFCCARDDA